MIKSKILNKVLKYILLILCVPVLVVCYEFFIIGLHENMLVSILTFFGMMIALFGMGALFSSIKNLK